LKAVSLFTENSVIIVIIGHVCKFRYISIYTSFAAARNVYDK